APLHAWTTDNPRDVLSIAAFFAVALAVSSVVELAARRTQQATRLRAEPAIPSMLAGSGFRGQGTLAALLERAREAFAMDAVSLLEQESESGDWRRLGSVGPSDGGPPPGRREDGEVDMPVGDRTMLVLSGRMLPAEDRRLLAAFAAQTA